MNLGFTGTHLGMTPQQRAVVGEILAGLEDGDEFHSGDCIGADKEAFNIAHALGKKTVGWPPKNPIKRAWCKFDIINPEGEYLARNRKIVDNSDTILATPRGFLEQIRSGTWAAVRYARKVHKPIIIIWPDGTWEWDT